MILQGIVCATTANVTCHGLFGPVIPAKRLAWLQVGASDRRCVREEYESGLTFRRDSDKIAEAAIGLIYVTFCGPENALRASKGLRWDVLDLLKKGWIGNPTNKFRRWVDVTDDGETQTALMFSKYFGKES